MKAFSDVSLSLRRTPSIQNPLRSSGQQLRLILGLPMFLIYSLDNRQRNLLDVHQILRWEVLRELRQKGTGVGSNFHREVGRIVHVLEDCDYHVKGGAGAQRAVLYRRRWCGDHR